VKVQRYVREGYLVGFGRPDRGLSQTISRAALSVDGATRFLACAVRHRIRGHPNAGALKARHSSCLRACGAIQEFPAVPYVFMLFIPNVKRILSNQILFGTIHLPFFEQECNVFLCPFFRSLHTLIFETDSNIVRGLKRTAWRSPRFIFCSDSYACQLIVFEI